MFNAPGWLLNCYGYKLKKCSCGSIGQPRLRPNDDIPYSIHCKCGRVVKRTTKDDVFKHWNRGEAE